MNLDIPCRFDIFPWAASTSLAAVATLWRLDLLLLLCWLNLRLRVSRLRLAGRRVPRHLWVRMGTNLGGFGESKEARRLGRLDLDDGWGSRGVTAVEV